MSSPLSGFTAVPNPQMLAFMGAQSFIMMYQAGEGWQYGKRRISAMSNEEFNKLTPESVMEKQAVVLRNSLGTIQRSMNDMTPMIRTIVEQYGDFIREIIAAIPQTLQNITSPSSGGKQALLPGVPGFITPIIPYIGPPGESGGNYYSNPIMPSPPSTKVSFYSISQLKSMSNVQLVDLRNQINSGSITVHSGTRTDIQNEINSRSGVVAPVIPPTRSETPNDKIIFDYFAKKTALFNKVIKAKKDLAGVNESRSGVWLPWQKGQIDLFTKQIKTFKADYYRFMQGMRNSPVREVKIDANQSYQSRPF